VHFCLSRVLIRRWIPWHPRWRQRKGPWQRRLGRRSPNTKCHRLLLGDLGESSGGALPAPFPGSLGTAAEATKLSCQASHRCRGLRSKVARDGRCLHLRIDNSRMEDQA